MAFAFTEQPPILTGQSKRDLENLRDYLIRLNKSLGDAAEANVIGSNGVAIAYARNGQQVLRSGGSTSASDIEAVRRNAQELKSLIIKSANELQQQLEDGDTYVMHYADSKKESYDELYVANSEFGTFKQGLTNTITTTARGVVDSYNFAESIESNQEKIDLLQNYYTSITGEIRRGIVEDPETGEYVLGIAISQSLKFAGECGPSDPENPGDGYTYYYLDSGQTFGLYTSTGWQFWIDGYKKGWYSSEDGMLHVSNILVERRLQVGPDWEIKASDGGSTLEIRYIGE